MSGDFRGVRCATEAASDDMALRQTTAAGYPRCERLAGTLRLDGVPISASDSRLSCPCVRVNEPDVRCKHATRAEVRSVRLETNWACPVTESKPACLASLTAPERSAIETIPGSERRGSIATLAAAPARNR